MGLMDLYLLASWLPTTIAAQGISLQVAALVTGLMQIGGIAGAFLMSPIVDRMGPNPILPLAYLMAALCIALIGFAGSSVIITICAVFGAGFGIIGCQCSDNGVVAKLYPMRMRATGVGWALGIGRLGSIVGPFLVGRAMATEMEIQTIFVLSAIPAVVAALAYFALDNIKMAAVD